MRKIFLLSGFFLLAATAQAESPLHFKPAVLNAALLFNHDPSIGKVKHSVQWIRDSSGKAILMTEVRYDLNGCFTHINMVDNVNGTRFHILNNKGNLSSFKGQYFAGKVNHDCQVTELENNTGIYTLSYNENGLVEAISDKLSGKVSKRFEYRYGQFPVLIRDYHNKIDSRFTYSAGSSQFLDIQSTITTKNKTIWLKQSCSYQIDGNAGLCALITAGDTDYRDSASVTFPNHQVEYY